MPETQIHEFGKKTEAVNRSPFPGVSPLTAEHDAAEKRGNVKDARTNPANEKQAYEALRLAQLHAERTTKAGKSSAVFCAEEAVKFFNEGRFGFAHTWAIQSLAHSVGFFHGDMIEARAGLI